jgi:hypothetical protein
MRQVHEGLGFLVKCVMDGLQQPRDEENFPLIGSADGAQQARRVDRELLHAVDGPRKGGSIRRHPRVTVQCVHFLPDGCAERFHAGEDVSRVLRNVHRCEASSM